MYKQAGQRLAEACDVHVNEVRFLESLRLTPAHVCIRRQQNYTAENPFQRLLVHKIHSIKTLQLEKVQQDLSKLSYKIWPLK